MTLTYWICPCMDDSPVYNFRARTKRECTQWLAANDPANTHFGRPAKVALEYSDSFDLMLQLSSEGGNTAESNARWNEDLHRNPELAETANRMGVGQ